MTRVATAWVIACGIAVLCGCSSLPAPAKVLGDGQAADTGRHVRFTTTEFTRPNIEVSPDGREFYFDVLGEIYRAPIAGGKAERLDLGDGWKSYPRLSRDGERLAFVSDKDEAAGVWGKRLGTAARVELYASAKLAQAKSLAWLGNGQLASVHRQRRIAAQFTLSLSSVDGSGKRISIDPVLLTKTRGLSLIGAAGDGESLYLFEDGVGVSRANVKTGVTSQIMDRKEEMSGQFRVSGDGRLGYAFTSGSDTRLAIYDQASKRHTVTACGLEKSIESGAQSLAYPTYAFLPDGKAILLSRGGKFQYCSLDGETRDIPVSADVDIALTPMAVRRADAPGRTQIRYPALDAKRDEIAFTAYGRLWKVGLDGRGVARLTQTGNEELMPAYSPDGTRLAYITQKDDVVALRVRDIESGLETVVLESREVSYANPAWSPDSRRIAYVEVDQALPFRAPGAAASGYLIKFIDLQTEQTTVIGPTGHRYKAGHLYARPSWSADGAGVYYMRDGEKEGAWDPSTELVYQTPGRAPIVLLSTAAGMEVAVSPSGRYVAIQDRLGISIMPLVASMVASPGEARHVPLSELESTRRIPANGTDYVLWTNDDRLLWSIQDEVFSSDDLSTAKRLLRVAMPASLAEPEDVRVYAGARILSMADKGVIENGVIVTAGSRISYVGSASDVPPEFRSMAPIDLTGKTIIPGLIDVHLHRPKSVDDFSSLTDHALFSSAAYGVTTVYDPALTTLKSAYLTDISGDDRFSGSTFYGSGEILFGEINSQTYAPVDDIDDARGYVERRAKAGTPLVKSYERTSRGERKLIAQAAREFGLGVASHEVYELGTQLGSIQDGYTAIEHTILLNSAPFYSDVIRYLKESGVSITPTLVIDGLTQKVTARRSMRDMRSKCLLGQPRYPLEKWTSDDARQARLVPGTPELQEYAREDLEEYARMLNDGLLISIGGHNFPSGIWTHWEMWALALGGATPMNVLRAATVNGAIKLNMQDRIGSIAEGMDADFVVLNSNPLDDIYSTTDIARVVRRGHTLQWPEGNAFPQSWPVDAEWDACQAWNLGLPRGVAQQQPALN